MNCKDIHYKKDKIFRLNNNDNYTIINGNTIIVEFMHYCYSHAIMDFVFPIYWIIQDIKKDFKSDKINLFLKTPKHPNNLKIYKSGKLIGVFNELINLLDPDVILFEFNIKNNLIFKIHLQLIHLENGYLIGKGVYGIQVIITHKII